MTGLPIVSPMPKYLVFFGFSQGPIFRQISQKRSKLIYTQVVQSGDFCGRGHKKTYTSPPTPKSICLETTLNMRGSFVAQQDGILTNFTFS